jgi:myo-inositol-1(or 4)-monophosphatase
MQLEILPTKEIVARFDVARSIILEAGLIANSYFEKLSTLTVKSKGAHDLVSEADVNTERFIKASLSSHFPDDSFFGEESGFQESGSSGGTWVVDPIDGTQPFLSGLPNWCISIAYIAEDKIEFGLVYNPPCNELFSGGLLIPATVNGKPIVPHPGTDLAAGMVSIGFSPRSPHSFLFHTMTTLLEEKGMFFRNGSGALSLAYVGAGRLLGHVEPMMHSYDCYGAIAIIRAAGGKVGKFDVKESLRQGLRVVAGAPAVFEKLERLLE